MSLAFPRTLRLTRSSEFQRVRKQGRSHAGRYLVLGVFQSGEATPSSPGSRPITRVGIITSRRVGNAVTRSRVRRRLREVLRHSRGDWLPGLWLVVVARASAAGASFGELQQEWLRLARRGRIFHAPGENPGHPPEPEPAR